MAHLANSKLVRLKDTELIVEEFSHPKNKLPVLAVTEPKRTNCTYCLAADDPVECHIMPACAATIWQGGLRNGERTIFIYNTPEAIDAYLGALVTAKMENES